MQQVHEENIGNAIKKRAEQLLTTVLSVLDIMMLLGHKLTSAMFWQITQKAVQTLNRSESEFKLENLPGSFFGKVVERYSSGHYLVAWMYFKYTFRRRFRTSW